MKINKKNTVWLFFIGTMILFSSCDLKVLVKNAHNGNVEAQYELALRYKNGEGMPLDPKMAMYWMQKAAKLGSPKAQNALGLMYIKKAVDISPDYEKALYWFAKAASQKYTVSYNNIARMYEVGMGVPKDPAQAMYWYFLGLEDGSQLSEVKIELMYKNNIAGVSRDKFPKLIIIKGDTLYPSKAMCDSLAKMSKKKNK